MKVDLPTFGPCFVKVQYDQKDVVNRGTVLTVEGCESWNKTTKFDALVRAHSLDQFSKFEGRRQAYKQLTQKNNFPKVDRKVLFDALLGKSLEKKKWQSK